MLATFVLSACQDDGPTGAPWRATGASAAVQATTGVRGLGGTYTIPAGVGAPQPLVPTGIRLPYGVPVRIVLGGAVTATPTEIFLDRFCGRFYPELCAGVYRDAMNIGSYGPDGNPAWFNTGAAIVGWSGGGPELSPDSGQRVLRTTTDGELLAGMTGTVEGYRINAWDPELGDWVYEEGIALIYGGGFTVDVLPDDGSTEDEHGGGVEGPAQLAVAVTDAVLGAVGGSLNARAYAPAGQRVTGTRWYVVYDAPGQPAPSAPVLARLGPAAGGVNASRVGADGPSSATPFAARRRVPTAPPAGATDVSTFVGGSVPDAGSGSSAQALPAVTASARSRSALGSTAGGRIASARPPHADRVVTRPEFGGGAAPSGGARFSVSGAGGGGFVGLDACTAATICSAEVTAPSGSILVVAEVDGRLLSAAARFGAGTATPGVTCTAPEGRGDGVTCTTSGLALVKAWSFTPDSTALRSVTRDALNDGDPPKEWGGPLVASGTISAIGWAALSDYPDGALDTASVHVTVPPRRWADSLLQIPGVVRGGHGRLPDAPTATDSGWSMVWGSHQLGSLKPLAVGTVTGGPNAGYFLLAARPALDSSTIFLNRALDGEGEWANEQTGKHHGKSMHPQLKIPFCAKAAFALLKPHVMEHEGVAGGERSHVGIWQRLLAQSDLLARWEAAVSSESVRAIADVVGQSFDAFTTSPEVEAAHKELDDEDDISAIRQWSGNCEFVYQP